MASSSPLVTIAMPAFNEEGYIETCIRSVQAQDYPRDRIEILVADGRSTDRTREILARLGVEDPRIRMIDNPDRLQAAGLKVGINEPYSAADRVYYTMDRHAGRWGVEAAMIEIRNDLLRSEAEETSWAERIGALLEGRRVSGEEKAASA